MKTNTLLFIFITFFVHNTLFAQKEFIDSTFKMTEHPRLLLLKGEEKVLKKQIAKDTLWQKIHSTLLEEADAIISLKENERIKTGRRLLDVSRENLRRIFILSYAYRMDGDKKYFIRAEKEMLKAASFEDWNPSHFLDVAEMTTAMSIGYDWLYPQLSSESKKIIETAIIEKGLKESFKSPGNWFVNVTHNWNQVCHTGMSYGAIAVWDKDITLSQNVINRAIEKISIPMQHYSPDGAYPEGVGYWEYGTSFNVLFLSAIEKIFGTDFSLSETPGFLNTGKYVLNMVTPTLRNFNYSDNGAKAFISPAMFWFYSKTQDLSILYNHTTLLGNNGINAIKRDRFAPAMILWGAGASLTTPRKPESIFWMAQGENPVCAMRSSWGDPNAVYMGVKLGSAEINHGHMDVGSFVFEADGINWAIDMGGENYNSLETKGVSLWGHSQTAQRWDVFRYNNFAHNTLAFNEKKQLVDGNATIIESSDKENNMYVTSNMSSVYSDQIKSLKRTFSMIDKKYVVIEDQIETMAQFTKMTWNMVTPATPTLLQENVMLLEKDGKKLYVKVEGAQNIKWNTRSAKSSYSFDSENKGITIISFDTDLNLNNKQSIRVSLLPESCKNEL